MARKKTRGRCLYVFIDSVSLSHSAFYSLWAVVVFPTIVGFPRYILCFNIAYCFLHSVLVHTSKVRLWPNELGDLFRRINRSPSVPLDGDSPQKVWTGKEVSYRHLKVFGCLTYVHVAKDRRGKLDPKTRPCIFLRR